MPRAQRVFVAACALLIAYALAYVAVDYGKIPHPTYDPLARAWRLAARTSGVPMGYVGLWLWALAAAAVAAAVAWLWTGRSKRALGERAVGILAAWTATAWLVGVGYYAWNNWP